MSASDSSELRKTPLYDLHVSLGARMVPFAGYHMPVQYADGLMKEHLHTRQSAGLFDVSHMGQFIVSDGRESAAVALERAMPMDVVNLAVGKQRYGLLTNQNGGIIDDLMFVRRPQDIFMIVNGATKWDDYEHLQALIGVGGGEKCHLNHLQEQALLALQGPKAVDVMQQLAPEVTRLVFMSGMAANLAGIPCFVTRSGYTGEDGFEISVAAADAEALAKHLLASPLVQPIGLGARNSLRLEAGLCLYGSDLNPTITPVEANLNWALSKARRQGGARAGAYPGADIINGQLAGSHPLKQQRLCLLAKERIPVREPAELFNAAGQQIGSVTSGLLSPILNMPIAMGYVDPQYVNQQALAEQELFAQVRNKSVAMQVVKGPFVPTRYFRG